MPGMRLAADRVAASLRRLDFAGAPVWQAARGRLAARLLGSPKGGAISGAAAAEDGSVDAEQLAVAVAAAQAAAAHVLLEAEGLAWEEPKPKARKCIECWATWAGAA